MHESNDDNAECGEPWYINNPHVLYPKEVPWFAFSACLRIQGQGLDFDEISRVLGVAPTNQHRMGERRDPRSVPYRNDAWHFEAGLDESRSLTEHINALWAVLKPHVDYLKRLKTSPNVVLFDVFCGYRSNSQTAGFVVDHCALELFVTLEIPFGVSVITLS